MSGAGGSGSGAANAQSSRFHPDEMQHLLDFINTALDNALDNALGNRKLLPPSPALPQPVQIVQLSLIAGALKTSDTSNPTFPSMIKIPQRRCHCQTACMREQTLINHYVIRKLNLIFSLSDWEANQKGKSLPKVASA